MAKYVNRTEVLRRVQHYAMLKSKTPGQTVLSMDEVASIVLDVSVADVVEARHAKWIAPLWGPFDTPVTCSLCHTLHRIPTGFCSACGAKMDGERREGDG